MASAQKKYSLPEPKGQWVAIIRVRGTVNVRKDIASTLRLLRLNKPNHCVVRKLTPSLKGMLMKAQHKIAWGEIDFETFCLLLKQRGRIVGHRRLTDDAIREMTNNKYSTVEELARAIWEGETSFRDLRWLKPVFRLHPPKHGGYKRSVKKLYQEGGALGYWGPDINNLLRRMI
mgnify:CR=1 FL=1